MPTYEVDYNYLIREFGTELVNAENTDEVEDLIDDLVRNKYPDQEIEEIEFETIKEIIR